MNWDYVGIVYKLSYVRRTTFLRPTGMEYRVLRKLVGFCNILSSMLQNPTITRYFVSGEIEYFSSMLQNPTINGSTP